MKAALAILMLWAVSSPPSGIETVLLPSRADSSLVVEQGAKSEDDNGRHLAIYREGHGTLVSLAGGLATVRESTDEALSAKNRLHSKYVFASAPMPDAMIMVFGPAMGDDPGALRIVRLDGTLPPERIFSDDTFALTDVRTGSDGRSLLVIGKRSLSQMSGNCETTYDPFSVFELRDATKGRFRYSLPLSKQYNLAHYAGWAGPRAREDVGVNICTTPHRIVRM